MGIFNVELKKVVDDSYKIEIGFHLEDTLINDLKNGLVGNISKFALITDSIVENLYAKDILERLKKEGYTADLFVFEAGEKQKTRQTKEMIEDAMLERGYRRDCCIIAIGGGVVTDLAGFLASFYPCRSSPTYRLNQALPAPSTPHAHRLLRSNLPYT